MPFTPGGPKEAASYTESRPAGKRSAGLGNQVKLKSGVIPNGGRFRNASSYHRTGVDGDTTCFKSRSGQDPLDFAKPHVRFDNGPELNGTQFRSELKRMVREGQCRGIHVIGSKHVRYNIISHVLTDLQRSGCISSHVIITGEEQYVQ